MNKKLFAVAMATILCGCISPQEVRKQQMATCSGYGFRQGTPAFSKCMMDLDRQGNKESLCRQEYWSAFSTAPPEKGAGYQSAVASKAEADCLRR